MAGLAFLALGVKSREDGKDGGGTTPSALGLQRLVQEVFHAINVMAGRLSLDTERLGCWSHGGQAGTLKSHRGSVSSCLQQRLLVKSSC